MKISVDVDCTPEEARRFLGLPDLAPLHEVYLARMSSLIGDQAGPEQLSELVKSWGPMSEASLGIWTAMMGQGPGKKA